MPRHSNQQIADALGEVLGVTISRRAVADWRRGFTEIKAAYLLAAFELAGIVQVLEIGALPAHRASIEPGQVLAPAAGGHTRRWNGRPRLQVIGAGLSFLVLLLWALPHTPLRPYVDVVVTYASHIAQPGSGGSTSYAATARAPSREPDATPQPAAPAATPATAATPPPATGQVDQSASTPARRGAPGAGTAATAAVTKPPANRGAAAPASPPAAAAPRDPAPEAGASGNQDAAQGSAQSSPQSQPPGLVPSVVNGVASTLDSTVGGLSGS
jgi:hypothetical protein